MSMGDEAPSTGVLEGTRLQFNQEDDVADLFKKFNKSFFWDKLKYVEVRWSPRMTLCAGVCVYHRRPGYCSIRLSRPLLSLRGKVDLVETLLHEMIHAFLFVTENNKDRDAHGEEFLKHMYRINEEAGLNISVYHTFKAEVNHYRQHVWTCDGPCRGRPPYYGLVHRSMNRAPGPNDLWWNDHLNECGGSFKKTSEPEGFRPSTKKHTKKQESAPCRDIRDYFQRNERSKPHSPHSSASTGGNWRSGKHFNKNSSVLEVPPKHNIETNSDKESGETEVPPKFNIETSSQKENGECSNGSPCEDDSLNDYDDYYGAVGSFINTAFSYFKRSEKRANVDPNKIRVRKPDMSAHPKSKRGILKNLIKVPTQPTLDSFYKIKRSHSATNVIKPPPKSALKQASVDVFFRSK